MITLVQLFDYVNQRTWEFGAESLGLGLSRRLRLSDSVRVELHGDLLGTVLASINSRFELVSPPENAKDYRLWEYGPGLGARAEALLLVGEHPIVQATYRYQWIHVSNGAQVSRGRSERRMPSLFMRDCRVLRLRPRLSRCRPPRAG